MTGRYGGIVREVVRIPTRRRSICRISLSNVRVPAHKFPCKHSLGLLFLYASQPDLFTTGEEPDWVKEWLEKRAGKAEEKKEKADKPVDVEAQAKRQEARHKKVLNGVTNLQGWLKDLVRSGLLNVPERAQALVCWVPSVMVDAQAPGLRG